MSFSQIDQALLDQGKILMKKVSLIPHIQKHSYQADIVVPYNPADPASDNEIELPSMGKLTCKSHKGLHLLHDNVTQAYMFKTFKYHKFVEHANAGKPLLFSMENGRLVDHEPELINMEAWNDRRDRYARAKADTDKHMHDKDTSLWDYYVKLEIAVMLRQIILMEIEERQIKLGIFAEARKWEEYEALMGDAPRERQISIDEDKRADVVRRIRQVRKNFHNHPGLR